jgi:protease-4
MTLIIQTTKEWLKVIVLGLIALAILVGGWIGISWYENQQQFAGGQGSCNVADITLYGGLVYYPGEGLDASSTGGDQTAAEDVRRQIENADADSGVKAIFLQIDSPGGDPVAGEDVAAALRHASKPTVVLIADVGDSAAYWAATGAQTIFASADASVGDIGVTQSYLDETKQDEENGLTFVSLTAGQYKDMGDPAAPLTPEERSLFQRDLNVTMQNFVDTVAANRNLSVASVTALADGSSMNGQLAVKDGLVDKVGNIYDVQDFLKGKIGDDVTLCE